MFRWIYIQPKSSEVIGSISSYLEATTTATGFPLYTSDLGWVLTEEQPGTCIKIRSGRTGLSISSDYCGGIVVTCGGTDKVIFDGITDDSIMGSAKGFRKEISPIKLFRVDGSTTIDAYCQRYEDVTIRGSYRVREVGTPFPSGCIIPVKYLHNGEVREGIGNYYTNYFSYANNHSATHVTHYYMRLGLDIMLPPMAITRESEISNKLVLNSINVGDTLDFGTDDQNIPSILKDWIDTNCDKVSDVTKLKMTSPGGIRLLTEESYCIWNIDVVPELYNTTITPRNEEQIIVPEEGYAGINQILVAPIPNNYIAPTGTKMIAENGTHDVREFEFAEVNVVPKLQDKTVTPSWSEQIVEPDEEFDGLKTVTVMATEQPQLYAPTASIDGDILTIEDNSGNGIFVTGFDIYVDGILKHTVAKE